MRKLGILLVLCLFAIGATSVFAQYPTGDDQSEETTDMDETDQANAQRFTTELTGGEEVPSVDTDMYGRFNVVFYNDENSSAVFRLRVFNGEKVTMAHLHCGAVGESGPAVAFLFGEVPGGFDMNGTVVSFGLHDGNILEEGQNCDPQITDISSLHEAINAGKVYANVHTTEYPDGEIRGQLGD